MLGGTNTGPRIGPVIINEIQYHPAAGNSEFIELKNPTGVAILLYDPERSTNRWRLEGADFDFPALAQIPANGLALVVEGTFRWLYGAAGQPYSVPPQLAGGTNLGFMFLPNYRAFVVVISLIVCIATWALIEKTRLGSYLRAATENPTLVQAFGINVPVLLTLTYALGAGLAGFTGVLAAPIYQVSPLMGTNLIIVVFAVVVVGGMGSIMGAIVTGYMLGVAEGLTKVFYPEASNIVIFVIMAFVLLIRPAGLFGKDA